MMGFKPGSAVVERNCSTNFATTTVPISVTYRIVYKGHRQLMVNNTQTLSMLLPSLGQKIVVLTLIFNQASMFWEMVGHFGCKCQCLVITKCYHNNVLTKRWQQCAVGQGIIYQQRSMLQASTSCHIVLKLRRLEGHFMFFRFGKILILHEVILHE